MVRNSLLKIGTMDGTFSIYLVTEVEGGHVNPSQHKQLGQVRLCTANLC